MVKWQIDYYDAEAGLPLLSYDSDNNTIDELPTEGVVWMILTETVDGQQYTMRCAGWDHYYVEQLENGLTYGGWIDATSEYGDHLNGGREFTWIDGENHQTMTPIVGYDEISIRILNGVLVPRPDSVTLGLED